MKEEIRKELESLQSILGGQEQPVRPTPPADYFSRMQKEVLDKANVTKDIGAARLRTLPAWVLAAAAVALLIAITWWPTESESASPLANVDELQLTAYLDQYIEEFDQELLSEVFADELPLTWEYEVPAEESWIEEALDNVSIDELEELL